MSDLFPQDMVGESQRPSREEQAMQQAEMQELAVLVAKALAKGESRESVIADLTKNGWEHADADEFVGSIEYHMENAQHQHSGGGEGMGWLLWIGGILLINFLSYVFGWGFWIY